MKHPRTLLSLATALLLASAAAAAQSPPAATVDPAVSPTALEPAAREPAALPPPAVAGQPQTATATATADGRLADRVADRNCLRHTGSLIRESRRAADRAGKRCIPAFGRAYSQDDLRDTGAVDLADALRRLDPAIH